MGKFNYFALFLPSTISSIQPLNWVLHKAKEIQHFVGFLCDGFEDRFIALLAAIEVGKMNSASLGELTLAKKRARELKRLDWIVIDGTSAKSSNGGRLKGRALDVVL